MAYYNEDRKVWVDNSGNSYTSKEDMIKANKGGGSVGLLGGMLMLAWSVLCLIPRVVGFAVGNLVGIILKLGIVGKVLLTLLVAVFSFLMLTIIFSGIGFNENKVITLIISIVVILFSLSVGAWFWIWHYKTVKQIPYDDFVFYTKRCVTICFWGPIVLWFLFELLKLTNKIDKAPAEFGPIIIGAPLAFAVIYWILKARSYQFFEYGNEAETYTVNVPPISCDGEDKNYSIGDHVWARWSGDDNLYLASIINSLPNEVKVEYYDGFVETLSKERVFYLDDAINSGFIPHGNRKKKRGFHPCNILEYKEDTIIVRYTKDQMEEELPYEGLVFFM